MALDSLGVMDERIYDKVDIERLKLAEVLVEVPRSQSKGRGGSAPGTGRSSHDSVGDNHS